MERKNPKDEKRGWGRKIHEAPDFSGGESGRESGKKEPFRRKDLEGGEEKKRQRTRSPYPQI